MRILVLIPYLALSYGGTSKVVREIVDSLGKRENIDIDVITTNADNGNRCPVKTFQWLWEGNYRVQYFPAWSRSDLILSPSLTQWLIQHMREYDLVHTHTVFAPLVSFAHWLCRQLKVPYIATPHGMLEPWALAYKSMKKIWYYDKIEKNGLKHALAIQAIASPEVDNLKKLGFQNSILVPNGLAKEQYISLPSPDLFYQEFPNLRGKKLILFLGRIDPKKGLNLLAPSFAKARSQFPKTHLVVAGPDIMNYTPTARAFFEKAGCLDHVTFTGMLSGQLKHSALSAASIYIAPSYSEGFSMSVLEGMACGLPCILTTGCNFPEAAKAQAAQIVDIDAEALSDSLLTYLHHPEYAASIGVHAREFIFQNYTWEASALKLINAYSELTK